MKPEEGYSILDRSMIPWDETPSVVRYMKNLEVVIHFDQLEEQPKECLTRNIELAKWMNQLVNSRESLLEDVTLNIYFGPRQWMNHEELLDGWVKEQVILFLQPVKSVRGIKTVSMPNWVTRNSHSAMAKRRKRLQGLIKDEVEEIARCMRLPLETEI